MSIALCGQEEGERDSRHVQGKCSPRETTLCTVGFVKDLALAWLVLSALGGLLFSFLEQLFFVWMAKYSVPKDMRHIKLEKPPE